ncbi:hypothetical protein OG215_39295 (plasmid) [Streptomyces globisporus]|uniref:hypothetical protein n=1 Tax=Streptomyces globisporus TaxID=1908 RepID=UPI00386B3DED|nr:hypothetical protein OG215_39295 [Streptomyces globisporus]
MPPKAKRKVDDVEAAAVAVGAEYEIAAEVASFSVTSPDSRPVFRGTVRLPSGLPTVPARPVRNSTIHLQSDDGSMIMFMAQNGQVWRAAKGAMNWAWERVEIPAALALKAFPAIATIAANYSTAHASNLRWAATSATVVDTAYNVLQPLHRAYREGPENIDWRHVAAGVGGAALSIGGALLSQLGDSSTPEKAKQISSVATALLCVGGQLSYEYRPMQEPFVPMVASPTMMSVIEEGGNSTRAASRRTTALEFRDPAPLTLSGRSSRNATLSTAGAAALMPPGTSAGPLAGRSAPQPVDEVQARRNLSRRSSVVRAAAR